MSIVGIYRTVERLISNMTATFSDSMTMFSCITLILIAHGIWKRFIRNGDGDMELRISIRRDQDSVKRLIIQIGEGEVSIRTPSVTARIVILITILFFPEIAMVILFFGVAVIYVASHVIVVLAMVACLVAIIIQEIRDKRSRKKG